MFSEDLNEAFFKAAERFEEHKDKIEGAFAKANSGDVDQVEPKERIRKYWEREQAHWRSGEQSGVRGLAYPELGMERVLGLTNDLLSIEFLEEGLIAASSVGMLTVAGSDSGTGLLIGNGLLLTNNHMLDSPETAEISVLDLNYEANRIGDPKPVETFEFDPGRFFITNKRLDFTVVAVKDKSATRSSIADFGYHPIIAQEGKILIGRPVNIIQHPKGRLKSLVVHDSRFMYVKNGGDLDPYCWYTSDTEPGSSGSPVFNNRWELVALHHKSIPKRNQRGQIIDRNNRVMSEERAENNPEDIAWIANEGIRASRLARAIKEMAIPSEFEDERRKLLALWAKPRTRVRDLESHRGGAEEVKRTKVLTTSTEVGPPITININIGKD